MINRRQLLCTFSNPSDVQNDINNVRNFYIIHNNTFFVFYNVKNKNELFITYNIINSETDSDFLKFPNTISIHRKKTTNTLYTLNAMNKIIRDENGGIFDNTFQVDWNLYKDSLIITTDEQIKIISILLYNIIK